MSKRFILLLLAVVAVVGFLILREHPVFAGHLGAKTNTSTTPTNTPAIGSTPVRTEGRLATYPGAEVVVSSERRGILDTLAVNERQMVVKGQLIAHLRSHDIEAQMNQERARIAEIKADIHLYQSEAERYQKLFDSQVGTQQAAQKAQRDLELAEARLGTEEAAINELQAELDKTVIVAPISGIVLKRNHQQGESVDAGEAIVTIADLKRVRIEAEIDEFDLAHVRMNAPVIVHAEGFDRTWKAHVEEVPDQVEGRKLKPEDPGVPLIRACCW